MKMGRFEKRFVNSHSHSRRVAEHAVQLLQAADPQPGQRLLDVGCGNGAAPIHVAKALGLAVTGVDVDAEQIETAAATRKRQAAVRFVAADATSSRLPTGSSTSSTPTRQPTTSVTGSGRSRR
jgi:cyclopropane fatty-acyl-phospholipid synthase-like methyltransferase